MMDQCLLLGVCLGWSIFFGLLARAWRAALAGLALFLNWFIWSSSIFALEDWEPLGLAMAMDTLTAGILLFVIRQPLIAASSLALVGLHYVRFGGWISYDTYYNVGWAAGMTQAILVAIAAWQGRQPNRWVA